MLMKAELRPIQRAPILDIAAVISILEAHTVIAPGLVTDGGGAHFVEVVGGVVGEGVVGPEVVGAAKTVILVAENVDGVWVGAFTAVAVGF